MPGFSEKVGTKLPLALLLNEQRSVAGPLLMPPDSLSHYAPSAAAATAATVDAQRVYPAYTNPYGMTHNYYYLNQPQHYVPYSGAYPGVPIYAGGSGMYHAPVGGVPMAYIPHPPPPLQALINPHPHPHLHPHANPNANPHHHPLPHTPQEMGSHSPPPLGSAAHAPAEAQKSRRFRRRYYQIYRKYSCLFPGCLKSYGLLNHLNTHIVTKKHGARKSKADFKHIEGASPRHAGHAGAAHERQEPSEVAAFDHENFHRESPASLSPSTLGTPLGTPLVTPLGTPPVGSFAGANAATSTSQALTTPWAIPGQPLPPFSQQQAPNSTRLPLIPSIIGQKPSF